MSKSTFCVFQSHDVDSTGPHIQVSALLSDCFAHDVLDQFPVGLLYALPDGNRVYVAVGARLLSTVEHVGPWCQHTSDQVFVTFYSE